MGNYAHLTKGRSVKFSQIVRRVFVLFVVMAALGVATGLYLAAKGGTGFASVMSVKLFAGEPTTRADMDRVALGDRSVIGARPIKLPDAKSDPHVGAIELLGLCGQTGNVIVVGTTAKPSRTDDQVRSQLDLGEETLCGETAKQSRADSEALKQILPFVFSGSDATDIQTKVRRVLESRKVDLPVAQQAASPKAAASTPAYRIIPKPAPAVKSKPKTRVEHDPYPRLPDWKPSAIDRRLFNGKK